VGPRHRQHAAATPGAADTSFVAPSFDCARPATASEEEICADPDLAGNDQKLNRAWKALLPRLDEVTRRALTEDQRGYVRAQSNQYPQFLHPAWEKRTSQMHYTGDGRDKLYRLQLERIALLEGFDESRSGFAGVWLAHNAILEVKAAGNGAVTAKGWKWEQGDWKAGCDFEMTGKVVNGAFHAKEKRKNPDTLERDHATLIVNRRTMASPKNATALMTPIHRSAGATTRTPRPRGCFRRAPRPTSTISAARSGEEISDAGPWNRFAGDIYARLLRRLRAVSAPARRRYKPRRRAISGSPP
jgi:uncharacterized protein